jgi:hypothetical protein
MAWRNLIVLVAEIRGFKSRLAERKAKEILSGHSCYDRRSLGTPRLRIDLYGYSDLAPQGDPILSYVITVVLLLSYMGTPVALKY